MRGGVLSAQAETTTAYDAIISNSHWYVPVPNLLAYVSPDTSFSTPLPAGDQTLWTLGTSSNGVFTGNSTALIVVDGHPLSNFNSMQGTVNSEGEITILFTSDTGGAPTLGVGNFRTIDNIPLMEMQMITGGSILSTHWAYMAPYDPDSFTPPPPVTIPVSIAAPEWKWTAGTPWKITSPTLFGTTTSGRFIITNYVNGYFIGQGIGPAGSAVTSFTELGSMTSEGSVLFNTIDENGVLTSFYGTITGDPSSAQMTLGGYDTFEIASLSLIPPYSINVEANNNPSAVGAADALYAIAGSAVGLTGSMAPVITAIESLSGQAQSNAISQTTPLLTGAGSQATANAQRSFGHIVQARQDMLAGQGNGQEIISNRNIWIKPYGSWGDQGEVDNVSGYSLSTGGIALGGDVALSPEYTLGVVAGFSNSSMDSHNSGAPSSLSVNSYHVGGYGNYAIQEGLNFTYQLDGAINRNTGSRNIGFYGVTANSNYTSTSWHAGSGLHKAVAINEKTRFIPSIRLDYLTVQSNAYSEADAGVLDLNVDDQSYQELFTSVDMRIDYALLPNLKLSTNMGAGYNALNERVQISASYAGGGNAFTTYGLKTSPWLYNAGLGMSSMLKKDTEFTLRYDAQATTTDYLNQMVSARVRMYF